MDIERITDGEMEITPQMLEAGIYEALDRRGEPVADTVRAIYAAMEVERLIGPVPELPKDFARIHEVFRRMSAGTDRSSSSTS